MWWQHARVPSPQPLSLLKLVQLCHSFREICEHSRRTSQHVWLTRTQDGQCCVPLTVCKLAVFCMLVVILCKVYLANFSIWVCRIAWTRVNLILLVQYWDVVGGFVFTNLWSWVSIVDCIAKMYFIHGRLAINGKISLFQSMNWTGEIVLIFPIHAKKCGCSLVHFDSPTPAAAGIPEPQMHL